MKDVPLLVTIAIPTYNRARSYLPQALESVLGQSYPHIEIIIADNESNDETEHVVRSYSDARIRYFRHPQNIGANNNFNFCLEQAQGVYFLVLPDDDAIDNDFIETCITALMIEKNGEDVGIIRTGMRLIDSSGNVVAEQQNNVKSLSTDDFILAWFNGKTWPYFCNSLFNTKELRGIGGFQSKHHLFQDVIAEMKLAAYFGRIDLKAVKASSRKHSGDRTSAARVIDWCEDSLELLEVLCALVGDKKHLVRREGMRFFSRINYNRARSVQSLRKRISLYYMVFKKFDFVYSPVAFLVRNNFFYRKTGFLFRRIRNFLA